METRTQPGHGLSQQCSNCDDSSARCWCVDCGEGLCDVCVSAHRRVTLTRSHLILNQPPASQKTREQSTNQLSKRGDASTPPIKFCRLHPSEPLKLFCLTCSQLTCRDCQLMAHMNHRYQFVSEALDSLKKQLEVWVQPIRAQRDTVRQSLKDMETRLQDIGESTSQLKTELLQSFHLICRHIKSRMESLFKDTKAVCETERSSITKRMLELKQLQQAQQSLIEAAEKAQNSNDVLALLGCVAQVESQLKSLSRQIASPPDTMSQLKVVTDTESLDAVLKFGELEVSWVPFSVSQTSSSSLSVNPSSAPLATPTAVTSAPAVAFSQQTSNPQPVSFAVGPSAGPTASCTLLNFVQPTQVLNSPPAPCQSQAATVVLLPSSQPVYQVFPMMLSQTAPCTVLQQKSGGRLQLLPVAPTSCPDSTPPTSSRRPRPQTGSTQNSSSAQLCLLPSSFSSSSFPSSSCSTASYKPLPQTMITNDSSSPVPETRLALLLKSSPGQLSLPPSSSSSSIAPPTCRPLPHTAATITASPGPDRCLTPFQQTLDQILLSQTVSSTPPDCQDQTATTSGLPPPPKRLPPDITSSSPVVRAVADSACDRSVQQAAARQQEPAENEPTSTVSEETEPEGTPSDGDAQQPSSVIGQPDCSLSQWQPRVSLLRLPVSPPQPGRPLPAFHVVQGDDEDEIYLEEIREDTQSHVDEVTDDITEPPSSPESPVTLQIVSCSACGSTYASFICSACGRGFHRDCHVPPVGPDIWSEWTCSLCQDLSDTADPYSSDRPPRQQSPCLSLLDQRRCESLLLHLKVEGCARLSELGSVWSDLKSMSERLTLHQSYQTTADFLSDVWSLFKDASQDEDVNELQESFQSRLKETFSSELHPSVLALPSRHKSAVAAEKREVITSKGKLTELRKRLRRFLVANSGSKRVKTE